MPIQVGDAVLQFLGDTTDLDRAWSSMIGSANKAGQATVQTAQEAVNDTLKAYEKLGIQGSLKLRQLAKEAQQAFETLSNSGMASMQDLVQAELRVIETQTALKASLGEAVPLAVQNRVETLKYRYAELTNTVEQYVAAQQAANMEEKEAAAIPPPKAAGGSAGGVLGALGLGGGLAGVGTLATVAAIYKVEQSLKQGAEAALEFDKAFTEVSTLITGKTPEDVQTIAMLKDQLLALPPVLGDITDLTHATYQALSAGIPAGQAVEFVGQAAIFARASLTDVKTSVNLLTSVINSYGLSAKDAKDVSNELFTAIAEGKTRGPELAEGLGRVLPIAGEMRISLAEVLAALVAMTKGGISTDEAVTSLRQTMLGLEKPSHMAQMAAAQLGISLQGIRDEIQTKGLNVAMADLASHVQGNTTLTAELFGNIRALTGVLDLVGPQAAVYAQVLRDVQAATKDGTQAQDAMNKMLQSQSGSFQTFGNTIKRDFLVYWDKIAPITNAIGFELKALLVDSGALQVLFGALGELAGGVALSLTLLGGAVHGVESAFDGLMATMVNAAEHLPFVKQALDANGASLADWIKRSKDAANAAAQDADRFNLVGAAMEGLGNKNSAAAQSMAKFAAQQRTKGEQDVIEQHAMGQLGTSYQLLASNIDKISVKYRQQVQDARDVVTAAEAEVVAARKRNASVADQEAAVAKLRAANQDLTRIQADAVNNMQQEEAAAKKTQKAFEAYASAHNVPVPQALKKAADDALHFYETLKAGNAPIESQVKALLNYNLQLGKLQELLTNKQTIGQQLAFEGADVISKLEPTVLAVKAGVDDAGDSVEAMASKTEAALKSLGVTGTQELKQQAANIELQMDVIRQAYAKGMITLAEYEDAQRAAAAVNVALADSLDPLIKKQRDAANAEQEAGIQGTQALQRKVDDTEEAYATIKKAVDANVESVHDLEQAELKVLQARAALATANGDIIPDKDLQRVQQLTAQLGSLATQQKRNTQLDIEWYQFWHTKAPSAAQANHQVMQLGIQGWFDLSQAIGSGIEQVELGQKSFGAAMKDATAQVLASISAQAAVQALWDVAKGFEALANPLTAAEAPGYFLAAAKMGAVAAVAGVAAAGISSLGGGSGSGKGAQSSSAGVAGSPSSATVPPTSGTTAAPTAPVATTNAPRFAAGGLISQPTLAVIGDSRRGSASPGASEAVLPLDDPEAMQRIAGAIAQATAAGMQGSGGLTVHVHGLVSPDNLDKVIDQLNTRVGKGKRLVASHANKLVRNA